MALSRFDVRTTMEVKIHQRDSLLALDSKLVVSTTNRVENSSMSVILLFQSMCEKITGIKRCKRHYLNALILRRKRLIWRKKRRRGEIVKSDRDLSS